MIIRDCDGPMAAPPGLSVSFVGCEPFELTNPDRPLGKDRADFQFPTHCGDASPQRADIHVSPVFELGDRGLIHIERLRKFLLRHAKRTA